MHHLQDAQDTTPPVRGKSALSHNHHPPPPPKATDAGAGNQEKPTIHLIPQVNETGQGNLYLASEGPKLPLTKVPTHPKKPRKQVFIWSLRAGREPGKMATLKTPSTEHMSTRQIFPITHANIHVGRRFPGTTLNWPMSPTHPPSSAFHHSIQQDPSST